VDTGYGSDLARTEGLLAESGIGPADLSLVVNTHHHSDHFASRPWAADFARHAFEADPREFARVLIEELLRSGPPGGGAGGWWPASRTTGPARVAPRPSLVRKLAVY
jgi:glyoxylase-like metal-dependent hydrolase (beta-lactamase superfamily II)